MRTVGTKLTVDAGQAKRELKDTERAARSFEDELVDAARQGKLTADAIADIGKTAVGAFPQAEKAAAKLNDEIAETAREIQRLDREFRKTGDLTLFADLERQVTKLQGKLKARDFFDRRSAVQAGSELAQGVGVQLMARLGPVMASAPLNVGALGPVGGSVAAALAASVVPILGSATAGAVIGGAGVGGVIGGLVLAARDPRVKAEGKLLGAEFMTMLGDASESSFVPVTRKAIATLRKDIAAFEPFVRAIFTQAARYVEPLLKGFTGLAKNALPGIVAAIERAKPVIDVIANRLPEVGKAVSDALEDISGDARSAAAGVDLILQGLIGVIHAAGAVIQFTTTWFRGLVNVADALSVIGEQITANIPLLGDHVHNSAERVRGLKKMLDETGTSAGNAADPFGNLAGEVERLNTALMTMQGLTLQGNEAERQFQQAIDDARGALDGQVKSLNLGTPKGRAYSEALDKIATTAQTAAQSIYDQTGSQEQANRKIAEGRAALIAQAEAYGLPKAAAIAYANKVLAVPERWDTKITAETRQAAAQLAAIKAAIAALRDKTIRVRTHFVTTGRLSSQGERVVGEGTSTKYSRGGPVRGGTRGRDSVPALLEPGEFVVRRSAVDRLGGPAALEAVNEGRQLRPLSADPVMMAPRWSAPQQYVGRGGGGGGQLVDVTVRLDANGADGDLKKAIAKWIRVDYAFRGEVRGG